MADMNNNNPDTAKQDQILYQLIASCIDNSIREKKAWAEQFQEEQTTLDSLKSDPVLNQLQVYQRVMFYLQDQYIQMAKNQTIKAGQSAVDANNNKMQSPKNPTPNNKQDKQPDPDKLKKMDEWAKRGKLFLEHLQDFMKKKSGDKSKNLKFAKDISEGYVSAITKLLKRIDKKKNPPKDN